MSIAITMPALSPTMEEGTLAKWLVKVGDTVRSGDIMAEIETDKATMEFEAVDEGVIADIAVPEGTEGVKVGTVIATLAEEGEDAMSVKPAKGEAAPAPAAAPAAPAPEPAQAAPAAAPSAPSKESSEASTRPAPTGGRVIASPLAKRIAADKGIDLASVQGSGPHGRIVKADLDGAQAGAAPPKAAAPAAATQTPEFGAPYEAVKLN
ncbi:MAG TPA: biotin/lipoyl-containing protein, partial [Croceibacterium sp.]|nr:biotin/lipoyl-containing protein [Croceibacterium sp.]